MRGSNQQWNIVLLKTDLGPYYLDFISRKNVSVLGMNEVLPCILNSSSSVCNSADL